MGSGPAKPKAPPLVRWRRIYQGFFLAVFFLLLLLTTTEGRTGVRVSFFLEADPLVGLSTLLATGTLYRGLLWGLALVLVTLVFGRVFCGWICPMGTMSQLFGWAFARLTGRERFDANRDRPLFRLKYYVLGGLLALAALGALQSGLLDPIALATRSWGVAWLPAIQVPTAPLWLRPGRFQGAWLIGLLFLGLLVANFWIPRFWCRALCPLGALLGLFGRLSLFKIYREPGRCNDCRKCVFDCQGADEPLGMHRRADCHVCLNCTGACPEAAISYRFLPPLDTTSREPDFGRRRMVLTLLGGAVAVPLLRATPGGDSPAPPDRIRPPGALAEEDFLGRCIKCGQCMKACPTHALHPAVWEAGVEGIWSPVLVPRIGYCEYACTLCGEVCPTGAIRKLALAEKIGLPPAREPVRIGTAFVDRTRCLPWAFGTQCIVCEEMCPTSPKAIWRERIEERRRDGSVVALERPHVDPDRCVGCGICETRCPVRDHAAIRVTSVGETRSYGNRMKLPGATT